MVRKAWIVCLLVVVIAGLSASAMAQDIACDQAQLRLNIQRVIDEGFNQGNTAVVDEVFAEDFIAHPDEADRDVFKGNITALRAAMPQGSASIEHVLVEGCDAFLQFHFHGTLENALQFPGGDPLGPTGEDLDLNAHIYVRFNEQGQIVEEWDYVDNFSLLIQTGTIPAPEMEEAEAEDQDEAMSAETITTSGNEARNTEVVRRAYEEGFNQGDMDSLREWYAADYVGHDPDGTTQTAEQLFASMDALRAALPDVNLTINDTVAQGDYVATRATLTGTFENELAFPGAAAIPRLGNLSPLRCRSYTA